MEKTSQEFSLPKEHSVRKPEKFILDATAGFRMMWFNKKHPNCIYLDQRPECEPDIVGDFRDLKQFPDETFRLIVFDPPHMIGNGKKPSEEEYIRKFGYLNPESWQRDLFKGFQELWKKLAPYGILLLKWSNAQIMSDRILALCSEKPLFYQITAAHPYGGKHNPNEKGVKIRTLWFCFMKIPKEES